MEACTVILQPDELEELPKRAGVGSSASYLAAKAVGALSLLGILQQVNTHVFGISLYNEKHLCVHEDRAIPPSLEPNATTQHREAWPCG